MGTSVDQEDLVSLIFGESSSGAPSDWREDPDFMLYLQELGTMTPQRVAVEPDRISDELAQVESATQDLAFSNYKTFIQTSSCSQQIFQEFSNAEQHLDSMLDQLPNFKEQCLQFQGVASEIASHRRLTSLTLSKHTSLLEILELPQLMETVVRNQHYEEALELQAYVQRLVKKQPGVPILEDIAKNVKSSMKLMFNQLLSQLRAPIQLPQCLKVVSYLRRMSVLTEPELRLKFLQCREAWLQTVVGGVPREEPYTHLTRTLELVRVHLFDIVTQYRAIFSDEGSSSVTSASGSEEELQPRLLFTSWLERSVRALVEVIKEDLAQPSVTSVEAVLGQSMYFGLSLSRVGYDFRPLLVPVFTEAVTRLFLSKLNPDEALRTFSSSLSCLSLARLPAPPPFLGGIEGAHHAPPLSLLDFPPLALITNQVLSALNQLRVCAPLSLAGPLTSQLSSLLSSACSLLQSQHSTMSHSWSDQEAQGWAYLCQAVRDILLPYLQVALGAVYPSKELSAATGLSREALVRRGVAHLDRDSIIASIKQFIPVVEPLKETEIEDDTGTQSVIEKMREIAIAVDTPEEGRNVAEDGVLVVDTSVDVEVLGQGTDVDEKSLIEAVEDEVIDPTSSSAISKGDATNTEALNVTVQEVGENP